MGLSALMALMALASTVAGIAQSANAQDDAEKLAEYNKEQQKKQYERQKKQDLLSRQANFRQSLQSRLRKKPLFGTEQYAAKMLPYSEAPEASDLRPYQTIQQLSGLGQQLAQYYGSQPRYAG